MSVPYTDPTKPKPLSVQAPGLQPAGQPMSAQAPGLQPASPPAPSLPPGASFMPGADPNDPNALVQMPNGQLLPRSHPQFQQQMGPGAAGPGPGPTTPQGQPTTQAGVLGGTATVGTQTPQGQPTSVAGAFQQALINRLAPQDITASNPAIAGSIAANKSAETRGLKQTRSALAERAAATGQSGAFETGLQRAIGESAGRQGAFAGNALYGLHQQQAGDLRDAMSLGGNMLSDQQRQELQRYGIDLDAALRREGLGMQGGLGNRELDIRRELGMGNLELGRQGIAANLGLGQANLNQNALLALLGQL